jgi:predicted transposase/invertase (TIGR01784 family)
MRYLDPKNELVFRKLFGSNVVLLKSFLNAILPIKTPIASLQYLDSSSTPRIPSWRNSIVDVVCTDVIGYEFKVVIQVLWTIKFKQNILFNFPDCYVMEFGKSWDYHSDKPVYALSLVNEIFVPELDSFYHHFNSIYSYETKRKFEGLEFIYVELPKFSNLIRKDINNKDLWLRFLTEITDGESHVSDDFLRHESINEGLKVIGQANYSNYELDVYDQAWDWVQCERTLFNASEKVRVAKGEEKGKLEEKIKGIIKALIRGKLSIEEIAEDFEVSIEFVLEIKKSNSI